MSALMGRVIRVSRRTTSLSSYSVLSSSRTTPIPLRQPPLTQLPKPPFHNSLFQTRNYVSEMRKSAFEGHIARLIRNEIQYTSEYAPPQQPITKFKSFTVEDRPGEQWIRLRNKVGDEEIKIEVTMFDGSVPTPTSGNDGNDEVQLHISLIVDISKGEGCDVLEFVCSAWPDCLDIEKVFMLKRNGTPTGTTPYVGPDFKDLDDELQNALQEFLEARGVTDELAEFLHVYMMNKDKTEFIRWMGTVKSFIEK